MTETIEVNPRNLSVSDCNERQSGGEADEELIESIRTEGGMKPNERPLVRPDGDSGYEIVYGQRRVDGSIQVGLETIEVEVEDLTDSEARVKSNDENRSHEMAKSVPIRDRSLNLWNHWQDMDGEGFPSATKLGEEFGECLGTVSNWIEPLREEWKDSVIDPRSERGAQTSFELNDVGESVLKSIRNIPGLESGDRIDLVEKVAAGEETRKSIRQLKNQIEESDPDLSEMDFTEEVSVQQEETEPTETDQQIAESTGTDAETVATVRSEVESQTSEQSVGVDTAGTESEDWMESPEESESGDDPFSTSVDDTEPRSTTRDIVPEVSDGEVEEVRENLREMERRREALRDHPDVQEAKGLWDNSFAHLAMQQYQNVAECPCCGGGFENLKWTCCDVDVVEANDIVHENKQEHLDGMDDIEEEIDY